MPTLAPLSGGRTPGRLTAVQHGTRVAAAALLSVTLSGCGSLYLHNDAAAKSTAQAKTELDKVDMAALFDNEEAYLKDLEKRENAAVAEQFSARRDEELLEILRGADDTDGRFTLTFHIDQYLEALTGRSDRVAGSAGRLAKAVTDAYADVNEETTLAKALKTRVNPTPPPATSTASSPNGALSLASAIEELQAQEDGLKKKEADAKAAQAEFKEQLEKAGDALAAGHASQAAFNDIVTKMNQLLADAKAGTEKANPYVGQLISEALLEKVDHLIDVTNPDGLGGGGEADSEARAALGFIHAAFGVGDAFANPPRVPHPNALAATKAWLTYVAGQADTDLAETRAKQAVLRARVAAVAQQVYYLSLAGAAVEPIRTAPTMKKNEGLTRLLAGNDPERAAATAALYYYTNAWTKGFIPAQQLNQSQYLVERRAKLKRSRQAGEAWLGTLKPAVATLAAYGEGGVDPHIIAELLQVLGITAIAAGVN